MKIAVFVLLISVMMMFLVGCSGEVSTMEKKADTTATADNTQQLTDTYDEPTTPSQPTEPKEKIIGLGEPITIKNIKFTVDGVFFTLTTLTSVAADSQPGSIFFPFKNTAVKIQSAFIKNSPTPTMTPSPSPTGAPSLTPTPTVTKIPVKPTVKLTVKPTLTLLPSKALILPPIESGKLSPTPTPLSLLNIDVQLPKTGIHLSL